MISIHTLRTLPSRTLLRKIVTILEELEHTHRHNAPIDWHFFREICLLLSEDKKITPTLRNETLRYASYHPPSSPNDTGDGDMVRIINRLRHALLNHLGQAPGEWDLWDENTGLLAHEHRTIREYYLFLEEIRSPYNVGSIFRVADSFGVRHIYLSPFCAMPTHRRAYRSSMGTADIIPWSVMPLEEVMEKLAPMPIFALETGGTPLSTFTFPHCGLMLIGSEELGLSAEALTAANNSARIVSIDTAGTKISLNVSVAAGIVMHRWFHHAS